MFSPSKWPSDPKFCERYLCSWQKMARNDCKSAKCKSCPFHFESEFMTKIMNSSWTYHYSKLKKNKSQLLFMGEITTIFCPNIINSLYSIMWIKMNRQLNQISLVCKGKKPHHFWTKFIKKWYSNYVSPTEVTKSQLLYQLVDENLTTTDKGQKYISFKWTVH